MPRAAAAQPARDDLRGQIPGDGIMLRQGPGVSVVGESFYRANISRVLGGAKRDGVKVVMQGELIREPKNRKDPNAITVRLNGEQAGYLKRTDAIRYQPVMQRLEARGLRAFTRADVRGGWKDQDGNWADYGVTLYVDSPKSLGEWLDKMEAKAQP